MADDEIKQRVETLENTIVTQNDEIVALKIENRNLHARFDELSKSIKILVGRYDAIEKRLTADKMGNIAHEVLPIGVPMTAVLPTVSNPATSTPSEIGDLTDTFAKLPTDKLAAEMWKAAMENMPELSGPATADLIEKQMENFAKFITSVSAKQNFCDAVKNTCRERGFSKGIARKMQKQANDIRVPDDN